MRTKILELLFSPYLSRCVRFIQAGHTNEKTSGRLQSTLVLTCSAALLFVTGCKTIPSDSVVAFSNGITTARTQSQEAFATVNEMVADTSLDFAASQPTLKEDSFAAGLDQESLQAWDGILEKLEKYAHHLQSLTSPDVAKSFDDEAVNLSGELKDFGQHLQQAGFVNKVPQISPALATGFTKLGELIIRFHSQATARKVMAETDSEMSRIFHAMADSVGTSYTNGIRGTVTSHRDQRLAEKKVAFVSASGESVKRQTAKDFRDLLERRTAQDLVLVSLRRSLIQLGDLHHSLAQGQQLTAQAAAAAIADEIKRTRDLNDRFKAKIK